jgi:two-component system, OmpR family, sensor kinase
MTLPIRTRLTLVYAAGAAVILAAFSVFVYALVRYDLTQTVDLGLRSRAQTILDAADRGDLGAATGRGPLADTDEAFSQVIDQRGVVIAASDPAGGALPPVVDGARLTRPTFFDKMIPAIDSAPLRLLAVPGTARGEQVTVVVGATLGDRQDALHVLLVALGTGTPVAVVLTALAAWFVAGRGLRPVEELRRQAAAISASDLGHRLPVPTTRDEIARLASTLNSLLDRLETTVGQQLRFVDDASHELRTPLSILKMELDLALARPREAVELTGALRAASAETDRLVALAEDLLILARQSGGQLPARRQPVVVASLLADVAAAHSAPAAARDVSVAVEAIPESVMVDPVQIRQAVGNLVDNAIRASPPGGTVRLGSRCSGTDVCLMVDDGGPGFPDDLVDRAFEPFTRGPASGTDSGAGLGLAIVKAIATAHRGTARAENLSGGGARVTLILSDAVVPATDTLSPVRRARG